MNTIELEPNVVTGDVVIGPWAHYEFQMRGEIFLTKGPPDPYRVMVWLINPVAGLKWKVCEANAAYTISDVVFTELLPRDERYAAMWGDTVARRLVEGWPGLWRRTVAAQLIGAYMRVACATCEEVAC